MPQVEVTFDIDANGIMHISAKDKNTGKENKITIKSDSGLSKEQIDEMIRDAEANAESDKKVRELIDVKNSAESQLHQVKKDLEEFRSELTETEISDIEKVIEDVESAAKGDSVDAIKSELEKVVPAMSVLLQKRQLKEQGQTPDAQPTQDDNVVDATFTETKKD